MEHDPHMAHKKKLLDLRDAIDQLEAFIATLDTASAKFAEAAIAVFRLKQLYAILVACQPPYMYDPEGATPKHPKVTVEVMKANPFGSLAEAMSDAAKEMSAKLDEQAQAEEFPVVKFPACPEPSAKVDYNTLLATQLASLASVKLKVMEYAETKKAKKGRAPSPVCTDEPCVISVVVKRSE